MTKVLKGFRHSVFFHPLMIAHTLVLLALITLFMILAFRSASSRLVMITFAIGWILWTFAEYALNRWLSPADGGSLLLAGVFKHNHTRHHVVPANIRSRISIPVSILIP